MLLGALLPALDDRPTTAAAMSVGLRHQELSQVRRPVLEWLALNERYVEEAERQIEAASDHGQAGAEARIHFSRQESILGHHAVDGEGAPKVDAFAECPSDPSGQ